MQSAETAPPAPESPDAAVLTAPFTARLRAAWHVLFGNVLSWNDPQYLATRSSTDRALRFILALLFIQRASYLLPAIAAAATAPPITYQSATLNAALLALAGSWNVALLLIARRRGWFPRWTIWTDLALVVALLFISSRNVTGADVFSDSNWPVQLALAAAALTAAAFRPWLAATCLAIIAAALLAAAYLHDNQLDLLAQPTLSVLNGCLWYAVAAHFVRRYLSGQGRILEKIQSEQLRAETQRAASSARATERQTQYRHLHNTVLTTLTAIARGGLDHKTTEVQRRCAAEAAYLRALITNDPETNIATESRLQNVMSATLADVEALGLEVHVKQHSLPERIPGNRCDTLSEAVREALNNVLKHSGTTEAWLTAFADDTSLTVRIVDRGRGFDPATTPRGYGITHAIEANMHDIGGTASIDSSPGDGTIVELSAPLGE
ncbi:sensor histidine kinase [Lolliginicoccus levis]|uniref:sensor histidine kinase n=1 Tax=Lolliginicoccus levis TaxID=2919542 RepID=UPI00241E79D1|nr:ATP-binding protein [Lolliginicoccus levis]